MPLRFRRSVKLAPGIRLNFSGSGLSWTLGPRGASLGVGRNGTYLNSGIPGTGLYSRTRLGRETPRTQATGKGMVTLSASVSVSDEDGTLSFDGPDGQPLSPRLVAEVKKQKGDAIRGLITECCAKVNAPITALGTIHHGTPDPRAARYRAKHFADERPTQSPPKPIGFLDRILFRRSRIEEENAAAEDRYRGDMEDWEAAKRRFEGEELARKLFLERQVLTDVAAMDKHLEATLMAIDWPRETLVSYDLADDGTSVALDVDLPEVEDMPNRTAVVPAREFKLAVKPMTVTAVQRLYMEHVHGIGVRILGEVFAALPTVTTATLSAYSQRTNKATGQVADEYLYSSRVTREQWLRLNFANLESVDVVEALAAFDLRRTMSKTGVFKPIQPFDSVSNV